MPTTRISLYVAADEPRPRHKRKDPGNLDRLRDIAAQHGFTVVDKGKGNERHLEGPRDKWREIERSLTRTAGFTIFMVTGEIQAEPS